MRASRVEYTDEALRAVLRLRHIKGRDLLERLASPLVHVYARIGEPTEDEELDGAAPRPRLPHALAVGGRLEAAFPFHPILEWYAGALRGRVALDEAQAGHTHAIAIAELRRSPSKLARAIGEAVEEARAIPWLLDYGSAMQLPCCGRRARGGRGFGTIGVRLLVPLPRVTMLFAPLLEVGAHVGAVRAVALVARAHRR